MLKLLPVFIFYTIVIAEAQTGIEYFDTAEEYAANEKYDKAVKFYTKAIDQNSKEEKYI